MNDSSLKTTEYYQQKHQLSAYTIGAFHFFLNHTTFAGKRVLEIGGSNLPEELIFSHLGAKQWICVDIIGHISGAYQKKRFADNFEKTLIADFEQTDLLSSERHVIFNGDATELPNQFYEKFDIVVSFATLEHVLDIPTFLEKIQNSLRPDGLFLTQFAPLWSCHCGHHCWVNKDINFQTTEPIGDWAHLLLSPPAMYERLIKLGRTKVETRKTIEQIYFLPRINRVFADDYKKFVDLTGFKNSEFHVAWKKDPSPDTIEQLKKLHGGYNDFSSGAFRIVCRK